MSPPDNMNVRVRPPDLSSTPGGFRPSSRAMVIQVGDPLQHSSRHLSVHDVDDVHEHDDDDDEDDEEDDEEEHEPLRYNCLKNM